MSLREQKKAETRATILAAARTGYFPDRTPAGSLVIWTESGGGGMALDTSGMDEELLRQLDALGYAD